jgi:hypothetical protein
LRLGIAILRKIVLLYNWIYSDDRVCLLVL